MPDAETAGSHRLQIECLDVLREPQPMASLVVTASAPDQPVRQLSVSRLSSNVFEATLELVPGNNVLVATGRTANGARLRAEIPFTIPQPR
jgi:hypothetical protein